MTYQKIGDIVLIKGKNCKIVCSYRLLALVSKTNINQLRINEYDILNQTSYTNPKISIVLDKHKLDKLKFNTIHFQNHLKFYIDISKMYFSGKYATYRLFLQEEIKDKHVLIMFNGAGPYAITLAKLNKSIIGVDVNYVACQYFEINCQINKIYNCTSIKSDFFKFNKSNQPTDTLITILPSLFTNFWPYCDRFRFKEHLALILVNVNNLKLIILFFQTYYGSKVDIKLIRSYSKFSNIYYFKLLKKTTNYLSSDLLF